MTSSSWSERGERWLNPILLRSLRQALRSRAFLGLYLLALAVAGLAGMTSALSQTERSSGSGRAMFLITVMAWTFAAWVVVPIQAFNAVVRERHEDTWDLVQLTSISPHRVVRGLIGTALMQALVIGAALAPFLVLGYLLRGLDLGLLVLALVLLPVGTLGLAAAGVFLGCLGHHRALRTTLGGLMAFALIGLWIGMMTFWGMSADMLARDLAASWKPWWGLAAFIDIMVSGTVVLVMLAAALLTHPAQDRSSPLRVAWLAMWMNGAAIISVELWDRSASRTNLADIAIAFGLCGVFWFLLLGLFAVTESDGLTHRQRQSVVAGGLWRQRAMAILGPGARRGRRATLLFLILALVPSAVALIWSSSDNMNGVRVACACACYIAALLGLVEPLMRKVGGRWVGSPAMRRAALIACAALWIAIPACVAAVLGADEHSLLMGLCPLAVAELDKSWAAWGDPAGWMAVLLGLAGAGVLAWNARPHADDEVALTVNRARE
jgi:hypothetical protein